jgi:hypothetical protein
MAVTITNDAGTTRTNLGLGDAATKTVGTASGNIPVLDSSGDLPTSTYTDTVYTHPTTAGNKHIPTAGATDQVLTYSSSGTASWQDAAAGGKLLQMQTASTATASGPGVSPGQNTWYDSPLVITFTPLSATSKILIMYDGSFTMNNLSGDGGVSLRLKRTHNGATTTPDELTTDNPGGNFHAVYYTNNNTTAHLTEVRHLTIHAVEAAAHVTTSSMVYTMQFGGYNMEYLRFNDYGAISRITIIEVES